jgi:hypothetical protein
MSVQNSAGARPSWAWGANEVTTAPPAVTFARAAEPEVELVGREMPRPSWAWGGDSAAVPATPAGETRAPAPVSPAVMSAASERPAWSWGATHG